MCMVIWQAHASRCAVWIRSSFLVAEAPRVQPCEGTVDQCGWVVANECQACGGRGSNAYQKSRQMVDAKHLSESRFCSVFLCREIKEKGAAPFLFATCCRDTHRKMHPFTRTPPFRFFWLSTIYLLCSFGNTRTHAFASTGFWYVDHFRNMFRIRWPQPIRIGRQFLHTAVLSGPQLPES